MEMQRRICHIPVSSKMHEKQIMKLFFYHLGLGSCVHYAEATARQQRFVANKRCNNERVFLSCLVSPSLVNAATIVAQYQNRVNLFNNCKGERFPQHTQSRNMLGSFVEQQTTSLDSAMSLPLLLLILLLLLLFITP